MITNTPSDATIIATTGIHVIDIATMTDVTIVVGTDELKTLSDSRGRASLRDWPFPFFLLAQANNMSPAEQTTGKGGGNPEESSPKV